MASCQRPPPPGGSVCHLSPERGGYWKRGLQRTPPPPTRAQTFFPPPLPPRPAPTHRHYDGVSRTHQRYGGGPRGQPPSAGPWNRTARDLGPVPRRDGRRGLQSPAGVAPCPPPPPTTVGPHTAAAFRSRASSASPPPPPLPRVQCPAPFTTAMAGRHVLERQDAGWRGGSVGPHARGNRARHEVDDLSAKGSGQQNP